MRNHSNTRPTLIGLSGAIIRRKGAGRFIVYAMAAAIGVGMLVGGQQFGARTSPAAAPAPAPVMVSSPLGIDLPAGADPATLPAGLTDYLRLDQ